METYQPADQELGAVSGCFCERLVQEKGISNRSIDNAIKDVRKSLALSPCQCECFYISEDKRYLRQGFGSS